MGATDSQPSISLNSIPQINQTSWHSCASILRRSTSTAKLHTISAQCKPIATYCSPQHNFLIDEYLVQINDKNNKQAYFQMLQWRNASDYLVHYKYIKGFNQSFICQSVQKHYLYIEHVPLRLSQITDIPFPDSLYLIYASLKGFQYIYQKFQNLEVREDLVCLNKDGKIKVWMNANLSAITPSINNVYVSIRKSEISIVNDILKMVNANIDHEMQPKNFQEYLIQQKINNLTFYTAIKAVQRFAYLLNANIPNYLQSAYDLFNPFLTNQSIPVHSPRVGREQTVQTKMIQSIPIYSERINNQIHYNSVESKVIKYEHQYFIPGKNDWRKIDGNNQGYPFESFVKINHFSEERKKQNHSLPIFKQYTPIYVGIDEQKPQIIAQSQQIQSDQQQWKYFNDDKWTQIDPQILSDLKKIKATSQK